MEPEDYIKKWNENSDDPVFKTKKGMELAEVIQKYVKTYKSIQKRGFETMTGDKKETVEIRVPLAFKNWLDTHKLDPEESYSDVLLRIIDSLGH